MPPLRYHEGQLAIQREASTEHVAGKLAHWVGPVAEFCALADVLLFAREDEAAALRFVVLSGAPPLVDAEEDEDGVRVLLPPEAAARLAGARSIGGLAIRLDQARRARVNGAIEPTREDGRAVLAARETFTLCRKYIAPSIASAGADAPLAVGPTAREPIDPRADAWLPGLLAAAETAWIATHAPDGTPDVAHRGGPPGFLRYDARDARLEWSEYVGDGVFKSAGNVRATRSCTLLAADLAAGEGVELVGKASYRNLRADRRHEPLVQHPEPFPVQGIMTLDVEKAHRLRGVWARRDRLAAHESVRITSKDAVDDQAPQ